MAIQIKHAFVSAKTDGGDTSLVRPSNWNAALVVSGLGTNQLLYSTGATTLAQSANLAYSDTGSPGSGPFLTVGSGATTSAGFSFGEISSNLAGIWLTGSGAATTTNYSLSATDPGGGGAVIWSINGPTTVQWSWRKSGAIKFTIGNIDTDTYFDGASANSIYHFRPDGNNEKLALYGTAGKGTLITAGTATTDVQALSATQTWNAGAVTFTAIKALITDTASAAGSLLLDLQTGSGSQFSVGKGGAITTGGTAGVASFGPSAVASITVKNGIITAIS